MKDGIVLIRFNNGYVGIGEQKILEDKETRFILPIKYVKANVARYEAERFGEVVTLMSVNYSQQQINDFRKACELNVTLYNK